MTCPSCGRRVAAGVAICPKCDAVVDPSLFDNTPAEHDDAPSVPTPPRRRAMPDAPARKLREAPVERPDWRVKNEPTRPERAKESRQHAPMDDPEDVWRDVKAFVCDLSLADKLAFIGAVTTMLSCFFPWKDNVVDGDVLGLMGLGAAVFVVAVAIVVAIVIRVRKVLPSLNPLIPWLAQFGGASFCIVWCLVYMKVALDMTVVRSPIGNYERWVSSPSAGVYIALTMSVVMLAGTLMGLREKPS